MKPKKYDIHNFDEINRWFREMEGYLKTSDFVHQGTDLEGRKFGFEAFLEFKKIFACSLPIMKSLMIQIMKKGENLIKN